MKRLSLCFAILLVIFISCFAGFLTVTRCGQQFDQALQQLESQVYSLSLQQLSDRSAQLFTNWQTAEKAMVRFVRHNSLDEVTGSMARLEKLALYGDLASFSAELDRIRTLLRHVCEGETPSFRNIF